MEDLSPHADSAASLSDTDAVRVVEHRSWDRLIHRLGADTTYHSLGYHEASATLETFGTIPVLLHHRNDVAESALPLLLRPLPDGDGWDATSAYGYGGPMSTSPVEDPSFVEAVDVWAVTNNVVASFVRYHPVIGNHRLGPKRTVAQAGQTVLWNIQQTDLLESMHAHHRRAVRKADRSGIEVRAVLGPRNLQSFRMLYERTMRRQGARAFYLFPEVYWKLLRGRCSEHLLLLEAVMDEAVVAAILCLVSPPYLHYHLGASDDAGRLVGASNRLFLAAAQWGQERGLIAFHLGGGVGGASDSSLFVFKQRFDPTGNPLDFHVGRWVHDPARYRELSSVVTDADYFPPWRS